MTRARDLSNIPNSQTGFRNVIINGDMRIDQRNNGSSFSLPIGGTVYTYGTDRWFGYGSAGVSMQRLYSSNTYFTRVTGGSFSLPRIGQRIEAINSYHLAGQTVTLSFRLSTSSSVSLPWSVSYANTTDAFGTFGSPTVTSIASGNIAATASFANYSLTFAVPAAATTGLQILFTGFSLIGGFSISLTDVQLELGPNATPFERRPIGTELDLCYRYYYRSTAAAISDRLGLWGISHGSSNASLNGPASVPMRAAPTLSFSSINLWTGGTNTTISSIVAQRSTPTAFGADITIAIAGTAGFPFQVTAGSSTAFWDASAEL